MVIIYGTVANERMSHLIVSDYQHLWTPKIQNTSALLSIK